jgi:hypothetical protein
MDLNTKQVRTGNADPLKMKSPAGCGASLSTKDDSKNQGSRKVSRLRRSHFERPSDSFPVGRDRMVSVEPNGKGGWWALESDEGGGSVLNCDGTKQGAIEAALEWVYRYNAEMEVINDPTGGAR